MTFHCNHQGFTDAVNDPDWGYIGTGNVMSNTQRSNTMECNGFSFEPGRLQRFDLAFFNGAIPAHVKHCVLRETATRDVILYRFFHYRRRDRVEHGWVVTERDHCLIARFVTGPTHKSHDVIAKAALAVTQT